MTTLNYEQILLDLCESGDAKFDAISNKSPAYPRNLEVCVRSFEENAAAFILNLHAQWGNGGIQLWMDNGYMESDYSYLRSFLTLIQTETSERVLEMVNEAMEAYESTYDDYDCDDEQNPALLVLDALDVEYYAMEGQLLQDTVEWFGRIDNDE